LEEKEEYGNKNRNCFIRRRRDGIREEKENKFGKRKIWKIKKNMEIKIGNVSSVGGEDTVESWEKREASSWLCTVGEE